MVLVLMVKLDGRRTNIKTKITEEIRGKYKWIQI